MKHYLIYSLSTLILLFTACKKDEDTAQKDENTVSVTDKETGEEREEQAFTITNKTGSSLLIHGSLNKTFSDGECIKLPKSAFGNLKITTPGPQSQQKSICDKDCEPNNYDIVKKEGEKEWYHLGDPPDVLETEETKFNDSDDCTLHK